MDIVLLMALIVLLYTLQSFFTKLYTDKYPGEPEMASTVFTAVSGLTVVVITFFCFSLCNFTFNIWSMLIGVVNAAALFGYNYFLVKCSQSGPYSILMMFSMSGGIILPIVVSLIAGWDAWETPFEIILNIVCIALIITAVYFASVKESAENGESTPNGKISWLFMLSCIGLAVCNGVYGVILTMQQQLEIAGGEGNRDEMVITTYLFAALFSAIGGIIKKRGKFFAAFRQNKSSALFLAGASLVVALAINIVVIIIPMIPTTIFYTLDNSLVLIFSVLCSFVFFKEKLSKLNVTGVALMCLALAAMNLLPAIVPAGWVA